MTDVKALDAIITTEPPVAPVPYYFATKNGWYGNLPTLYGTAHIPVDKWPKSLPDIKTLFHYGQEKVPGFIFDQALDFFRKVYAEHKTEATTYICRDTNGQYSLFIPKQYVTGASVNHKVDAGEMGDRTAVGTIHSHCMMSAFHSGTDEHDMGKMPGVHATIGMVMADEPEYAIAIAIGDVRFDIDAERIIDENATEDVNGFNTAPDHWLKFVHPNQTAPWQGGISTKYPSKAKPSKHYRYGQMKPVGFKAPTWWDDDEWNWYSSYRPTHSSDEQTNEQQVMETRRWLHEERRELAELGYVLDYDIRLAPNEARDVVEEMQAANADDTLPMFGGKADD